MMVCIPELKAFSRAFFQAKITKIFLLLVYQCQFLKHYDEKLN